MIVYVIGAYDAGNALHAVKVGVTSNLERRLDMLQTAQFYELRVLSAWDAKSKAVAYRVESNVHHILRRERIRGEWFKKRSLERIRGAIKTELKTALPAIHEAPEGGVRRLAEVKREERDAEIAADLAALAELRQHGLAA
jgi:hypothetical protein